MGIKFLCPNGHKLHVKAFLSGKKAICPQCGARVVVPAEDATSNVADVEPTPLQTAAGEVDSEFQLESSLLEDAPEATGPLESTPQQRVESASPLGADVAATDPLEEAPQAAWYVRAPTGGQFGPASAEIMRHWLKEGRVGASALVWRAPWSEWHSAQSIFPQLASMLPPLPGPRVGGAMPPMPLGNGIPSTPAVLPVGHVVQGVASGPPPIDPSPAVPALAHAVRKRRRKNDVTLIASGVLVIASLILAIVLALVFRAQRPDGEPRIEDQPAADEEPLI